MARVKSLMPVMGNFHGADAATVAGVHQFWRYRGAGFSGRLKCVTHVTHGYCTYKHQCYRNRAKKHGGGGWNISPAKTTDNL
jgi:hypothetical protein